MNSEMAYCELERLFFHTAYFSQFSKGRLLYRFSDGQITRYPKERTLVDNVSAL